MSVSVCVLSPYTLSLMLLPTPQGRSPVPIPRQRVPGPPRYRLCPPSWNSGLRLSNTHSRSLLGVHICLPFTPYTKAASQQTSAQHQRGVPCPKLFSGPAWVTGIRALPTGGGTTQMSPASRGAGAGGSGCSRSGMWTCLESGFSSAFPLLGLRYHLAKNRPAAGRPKLGLLKLSPAPLPRSCRGHSYGGHLLGESPSPGGLWKPLRPVGSPAKLRGSPGDQQVSKSELKKNKSEI